MKKLGIRIESSILDREDPINPEMPLLAFAYSRSGFIRLAGGRVLESAIRRRA
jgi:hypothetical protein